MQITKELKTLIESIKVTLLEVDPTHFETLCLNEDLDWKRLQKMLVYHQVRPLFYLACKKIDFNNDVVQKAELFSKRQAIKNQYERLELGRIIAVLLDKDISVLPYKGLFFLNKLYQNHSFREIADMDIIVPSKQAIIALQTLLEDGYVFQKNCDPTEGFLIDLIENAPYPEISLVKRTELGIEVNIDFHWRINESPYYNIDITTLFLESQMGLFDQKIILQPNHISIYWMILNHHGARECWVKLKNVADLLMYIKVHQNIPNSELSKYSSEIGMKKIHLMGTLLLNQYFLENIPKVSNPENLKIFKKIIDMWEYSVPGRKLFAKFLKFRIYKELMDTKLSWIRLISDQVSFHSIPNHLEHKRLFILPRKYLLLNTFIKFLSYFVRVYGFNRK